MSSCFHCSLDFGQSTNNPREVNTKRIKYTSVTVLKIIQVRLYHRFVQAPTVFDYLIIFKDWFLITHSYTCFSYCSIKYYINDILTLYSFCIIYSQNPLAPHTMRHSRHWWNVLDHTLRTQTCTEKCKKKILN